MDAVHLQKQIRNNAEELQSFKTSLDNWEKEMKDKDKKLKVLNSNKKKKGDADSKVKQSDNDRKHEEADFHKAKGNTFVQQGKWKEAIDEYSVSIYLYPEDAIYYGNRSFCYQQLQMWKEAENDCNRALELKSDYVKVALRRANIRKVRGNVQGAAKDYNLVLILDPKNAVALREFEQLYPRVKEHLVKQGQDLPDFYEMNPSSKPAPEEELKKPEDSILDLRKGLLKEYKPSKLNSAIKKGDKASSDPHVAQTNKINDYAIIFPVNQKPPHLRSKLPLRKIHIEDVYLNSDEGMVY